MLIQFRFTCVFITTLHSRILEAMPIIGAVGCLFAVVFPWIDKQMYHRPGQPRLQILTMAHRGEPSTRESCTYPLREFTVDDLSLPELVV